MFRADFELIFSLLLLGYYIYTLVAKNKEKTTVPPTEPAPQGKKKKSFLEDFLEELEKQQKANQPPPSKPTPEPVRQQRERPTASKTSKTKKNKRQPVLEEWSSPEMEGGFTTMPAFADAQRQPAPSPKKRNGKIVLGNTVLSPKDAIVAQIVFERKF